VFDPARTTLSESVERWLVETRCIPQSVIAGLRITEQEEFMSQSSQKERCVCFNYFEDGQLVNTKFRSVDAKHFKMFQGAELIPYNIDSVLGQTSCIIHEGELDAASSLAAGFKSVISVPAGANSNLSWLDRFMETHFEDLTEVIIAVDTDSAGLQLRRYFRPFTNRNSASHPNRDIYISSSRGAYLGIDLRYTHFNEQLLTAGTPGREGDLISAGILLGYSFALDPCGHWAIDAALALGYQHQNYDRYTWYAPAAQSRLLGTRTHDRFTLTALDVALVYRF